MQLNLQSLIDNIKAYNAGFSWGIEPTEAHLSSIYAGSFIKRLLVDRKELEFDLNSIDLQIAKFRTLHELALLPIASGCFVNCFPPIDPDCFSWPRLPAWQIVSCVSQAILQILNDLASLRAQLVRVLLNCAALSSSVSIVVEEERFFEYNGTGRPPNSHLVLGMDLVPVF
jgi:hypothetical protein